MEWEVLIFPGFHHFFLTEEDRTENGDCPSKYKVCGNIHDFMLSCSAGRAAEVRVNS